jgi:hypothetical protein
MAVFGPEKRSGGQQGRLKGVVGSKFNLEVKF